jgi:hypothetical protein
MEKGADFTYCCTLGRDVIKFALTQTCPAKEVKFAADFLVQIAARMEQEQATRQKRGTAVIIPITAHGDTIKREKRKRGLKND